MFRDLRTLKSLRSPKTATRKKINCYKNIVSLNYLIHIRGLEIYQISFFPEWYFKPVLKRVF